MRFNLSRKILVVYGLLLSFSLIQGIALYSVVEQLRSYSALKELLIEFKFQIHALENLKDKVALTGNYEHDPSDAQHQNEHQHEPFEDEYTKTQDILSRLTRSNQKHILDFSNQFDDTATFLAHYRRAYFELHNLIHKEQLIHSQATQALTGVRRRFSILGPEASEQLFFLLLDNFAIESNILLDHNIKNLPPLKEMKEVITLLTNDQKTLTVLQNVINLTEDDYLNSLEILDRQTFLSDSAAHLVEFCDSATAYLTEQVLLYQAHLKRYLAIMVTASVLFTLLFFWLSRKYFKKFLGSQKDAISSIGKGKYDYQLPALPQDELGDLAIFMKDMAENLQQSSDEIRRSEERLSVTLRSIGDGVITTDIEGRVVLINKVAEELCGWSQTEAQGRPLDEVFQIINETTGEPCESPVEKVLSTGQVIALANHTALIARDGRQHSIADSGAAIRDQKSEIIGVVLVFRDVTDEKIKEKELLKGKKLESIGLLAGGIAHDFNNILSAILGNINLVRHIVDPGEQKAHAYLEEAEKASIRAQGLTQQLLTFSKGGEPVKQAASILDIIKDSTTFILRGSDIKYESNMSKDLWPVVVDPGQISQVVQNIVLNARHAMPGGGTLRINGSNVSRDSEKPLILSTKKDYVMVTIADSGIGIPASAIDNIFDPYFTTKQEGSGLGLSICHSIINKHSGYISVQSEQGRGTVFTIYLPAADNTKNVQETEHQEKVFARKNLSVLIMDDDKQIRTIAEAMLSHLGCRTLQASDGEEAIELYRASLENEQPIDAVIMDLTIPGGMGGKKAITEILKLDPGARAIVSSGYSNDPIMANCQEHGFSAVIIKPYQLKELATALDKALKK